MTDDQLFRLVSCLFVDAALIAMAVSIGLNGIANAIKEHAAKSYPRTAVGAEDVVSE